MNRLRFTNMKRFQSIWTRGCAATIAITAGCWFSASAKDASPAVAVPVFPNTALNITNFGAVGDGKTLNTESFAKAINALSEKGGGKLVVPPGLWLTGPIRMRSHINLHLERGALIQFSGDYTLYPLTIIDMKGEKEVDSLSPISGENLENVAITGSGILDGGGDAWRRLALGHARP